MGGQVSAGQGERLLNEPVGHPVRFGQGHQQGHYSQSVGLVDGLVEDDGFVGQWTPLLRIHHAPRTTTASISAADTNIASSPSTR